MLYSHYYHRSKEERRIVDGLVSLLISLPLPKMPLPDFDRDAAEAAVTLSKPVLLSFRRYWPKCVISY